MRWDPIRFDGADLALGDSPAIAVDLPESDIAVLEMALVEGPRSDQANTPLRRLATLLFGTHSVRPLANERLEAIRGFAVAAWYRDQVPERLVRRLKEAGVSSNETWQLLAYVAIRRGKMPEVGSSSA